MRTMTKLTKEDKKLQRLFMCLLWFKCCEYHSISKSEGAKSLIQFLVELGWQKKRAADVVLIFFKTQGLTENDLADLWIHIMGE